jgi:hypothetical protein
MKKQRQLTEDQKKMAVMMYRDSPSVTHIAKFYGVKVEVVIAALKEAREQL